MAKFIFKMQNVLNIKLRLETQAKTEFAEASARLATEEQKLRELLSRKRFYEMEVVAMSEKGALNVTQLKIHNGSIKAMQDLIEQQTVVLRIAERNMDRAREKLNEAMQERKVYEKLREKAFEEFKMEVNAEEKKEIDELVSFTYNDRDEE
ncbi:MAG: flagellar export protein FliJ [Lachnospira sp.]|nr:flagellar export protein FliJ [Lachnospira sp.]